MGLGGRPAGESRRGQWGRAWAGGPRRPGAPGALAGRLARLGRRQGAGGPRALGPREAGPAGGRRLWAAADGAGQAEAHRTQAGEQLGRRLAAVVAQRWHAVRPDTPENMIELNGVIWVWMKGIESLVEVKSE